MGQENVILANSQKSNLADYGYDMVVATTQKSINATMKEYLYNLESEEFIVCYVSVYNEDTENVSIVEKNYNDLINEVGGIDLFSIPADSKMRTSEQKQAINSAYNNGFTFAFKAKVGISNEISPLKIPNIIEFIESDKTSIANVKYKAFYSEFDIIKVEQVPGVPQKSIFKHFSQDNENPWTFEYAVKLDLQGTEFKSLPKEIQDKLKSVNNITNEIDTDAIFSIQQLYLDLNTTALQSIPEIEGIDPSDDAMRLIQDIFKDKYFAELKKKGDVAFGYTVAHKDPKVNGAQTETLIKPTDFNFFISPYYDASGNKDESKKELYTLNYLVMSDNKPFPKEIKDFKWNWITDVESAEIDGVMSINRSNIIELLKNRFTPLLSYLILNTYAKVTIPIDYNVTWDFDLLIDADYKPEYTIGNSAKVLEFTYCSEKQSSDTEVPVWGNITLRYNLDSKIEVNEDNIIYTTDIVSFLHLNCEGGVSEGNIYNHTLTTNIKMRIDEHGQIYFEGSPLVDKDNGTNFSYSGWSKFISVGAIDGTIDSIIHCVNENITNAKNQFNSKLEGVLENSTNLVFPGGKTFTFSTPSFSTNQDLVADIVYIKPEDNK